ncbi:DUF4149 domain-containing protein [Xylophilus ampelinus]|uniref:Uncharacterized protein DUF4149 n=1 Tax=Xylophilus ampelinus TaxID=54067 RepID=A0A318SL17_9BURK|nr:DUF4149 domain-containing protein [Xylophilus ampelinus]MCS4510809.1 DUF4149 domain-containing protein [Xylophilus ampelinus]PYE76212.1 uncharacterized protein DUF4149 [Xylophilus ampelinus]
MSFEHRMPPIVAALWWGSMSTIGFLVVPLLFKHLPTPAMAGQMAALLFTAQTWLSVACGMLLLLASRDRGESVLLPWARSALGFVLAGVLLALLAEFGVSPRIVARENLKLWHAVGSAIYLAQWVCAGVVLWKCLQVPSEAAPSAVPEDASGN